MANLKLKRLKIEKFRNVEPTELLFHDGLNVLLGQNGAGKTTLLKLVAMAASSDFGSLRRKEFSVEYDLVHEQFNLTVTLSNQSAKLDSDAAELIPKLGTKKMSWSYLIKCTLKGSSEAVTRSASSSRPDKRQEPKPQEPNQEPWEQFPNPFVRSFIAEFILDNFFIHKDDPPALLRDALLELLSLRTVRFDEGLGGFYAITSDVARKLEATELGRARIHIIKTDKNQSYFRQVSSGFVPLALGSEILRKIGKSVDDPDSDLSIKENDLLFLQKSTERMHFKHGEILVQLLGKVVAERSTTLIYGRFGFRFTLDDGSIISHRVLSYGQKRLLAFYFYSASIRDIVVADELVNGLHHEWIRACLEEIGDRQAFLTSQNPLLLDALGFESEEEAARTFVLCHLENRENKDVMAWRNMHIDEAGRFYRAYDTGFQHVGEILRTEGLW